MPPTSTTLSLFAACAPGLEAMLASEIAALGANVAAEPAPGGVAFSGDLATLYRANLELGLALKVLVRLGRFRAHNFARLERGAAAVDWAAWLPDGAPVRVRATCTKSKLYHSGAVVERVRGAVANAVSVVAPAAQGDDQADPRAFEIHARLVRDECVLSLDSSGTSLHKRGYRLETAKAPLREDLARALIKLSGWDTEAPLVDPMCGSGTLAIEAGLLARRAPPGGARHFAFTDAANFDDALWNRVRRDAAARETAAAPTLIASDRDAGAIEATARNAERAGVSVQASVAALSKSPGWAALGDIGGAVVTNPPYGARVSRGRDPLPLYQTLARLVTERSKVRLALVAADHRLVARAKLPVDRAIATDHGGKKVGLYRPSKTATPAEKEVR